MIIECIKCNKKFEVNSELIPSEGRTIQCGSCNHVWFFDKKDQILLEDFKTPFKEIPKKTPKIKDTINVASKIKKKPINILKDTDIKSKINKGSEIIEYKSKNSYSFNRFLSFILVIIISFVGLIIILDTFKIYLYSFFPDLEILLFSLFETLKDINLFVKGLF